MNCLNVNLVPRKRRAARRIHSCIRAWTVVGVAYIIIVSGACALVISATTPNDDPLQRDASGVAVQIAASKDRLTQTRAELANVTRHLAAAREIQGHPDWSVLLSLIAANRGDGLALASLELHPASSSASGSRDSQAVLSERPTSYSLRLTGLGKDYDQITQFAIRLETVGIFSRVVLKETLAKQLATRSVVSFGIECTLRDAEGLAGVEK